MRLLYLTFARLTGRLVLPGRFSSSKDAELLVLRHEVAMLRQTAARHLYCQRNRSVREHPSLFWAYRYRWRCALPVSGGFVIAAVGQGFGSGQRLSKIGVDEGIAVFLELVGSLRFLLVSSQLIA
jgi:hypothetical protein